MPEHAVQIAILGGGCAGLSLAMAIAHGRKKYPHSKTDVVILESRKAYSHDRNWSFWLHKDNKFSHSDLIQHKWSMWSVSLEGQTRHQCGEDFFYATIPSGKFYDKAQKICQQDPLIDLRLNQHVISIKPLTNGGYNIKTSSGSFKALNVVDTRCTYGPHQQDLSTYYQIFNGYEIVTKKHIFDVNTVGLMEDMKVEENGAFAFTYVLPFTAQHALIERTLFTKDYKSPNSLREILDKIVADKIGTKTCYEIQAREQAVLPMGTDTIDNLDHPNFRQKKISYIRVGRDTGAIRPSSGYAFLRLHNWAHKAAKTFQEQHRLLFFPKDPLMMRFLDRHFIQVLKQYPNHAPNIFQSLIQKTSGDCFAAFMSGSVKLRDMYPIIKAVPKRPFLSALGSLS